jgi:benzoate membrane transport protein
VVLSILAMTYGLFSPVLTRIMLATPKAFIATLAGLVLLRVLERAFVVAFSGTFTLSALVTFLVTVANVPILSIGAPFWALVIGYAVAAMLERDDLERLAAG